MVPVVEDAPLLGAGRVSEPKHEPSGELQLGRFTRGIEPHTVQLTAVVVREAPDPDLRVDAARRHVRLASSRFEGVPLLVERAVLADDAFPLLGKRIVACYDPTMAYAVLVELENQAAWFVEPMNNAATR